MARAATGAEMRQRAISRAMARGGAAVVTRIRHGLYRVASSSRAGRFHSVSVDADGTWRCDCEAGRCGKPCWAMGAVYIAKVEHASGGRVVGPAAHAGEEAPSNVQPFVQRAA